MNPIDQELSQLWAERAHLNSSEWEKLYSLVCTLLQNYAFSELESLSEDKDNLIHDFFTDKVMRLSNTRCHHSGALKVFFRNYLIDRLRQQNAENAYFEQNMQSEYDPNNRIKRQADPASISESEQQILHEHGLSEKIVRDAARNWLDSLNPKEYWIPIFLAYYLYEEEPLSQIAEKWHIPSYHYKATKIGLTHKNNDLAHFKKTLLGRWLTQLGLNLEDDQKAIEICLTILGHESLLWVQEHLNGEKR